VVASADAHPRILLQTTILAEPDDWHVGRFSRDQQDHRAPFNIAVAFEAGPDGGPRARREHVPPLLRRQPGPARRLPQVRREPPGDGMLREPGAQAEAFRYFANLARWLSA
jgi:hypothetical protein